MRSDEVRVDFDWPLSTVGEICDNGEGDVQTGPFGSQLHASDYIDDGIPSVMPQDLSEGRITTDSVARITVEDRDRLVRYALRSGDLVSARRGDLKRRALVGEREEGWLCGTGCLRVRPGNACDPRFLYYALGHPAIQGWIDRHAVGATMPNLNTEILRRCPVSRPPRDDQERIAAVLGALDDKIDSNRRLAALLEETAAALFKARFVDFVGVEEFEDSEIGPIPAGWRIVPLRDLLALKYGRALPAKARRGGRVAVIGSSGVVGAHDEALVDGPVVVIGRKGTAGSVLWIPGDAWPIDTTFYSAICDGLDPIFVYYTLLHADLPRLTSDSAVPGLNREAAEDRRVRLPPAGLVEEFASTGAPLFAHRDVLGGEADTLTGVRDALLPKLISGAIRVPDSADVDEAVGPLVEAVS